MNDIEKQLKLAMKQKRKRNGKSAVKAIGLATLIDWKPKTTELIPVSRITVVMHLNVKSMEFEHKLWKKIYFKHAYSIVKNLLIEKMLQYYISHF